MTGIQLVGDNNAENSIAQKFQALIRRYSALLVGKRPMGEREFYRLKLESNPKLRK